VFKCSKIKNFQKGTFSDKGYENVLFLPFIFITSSIFRDKFSYSFVIFSTEICANLSSQFLQSSSIVAGLHLATLHSNRTPKLQWYLNQVTEVANHLSSIFHSYPWKMIQLWICDTEHCPVGRCHCGHILATAFIQDIHATIGV